MLNNFENSFFMHLPDFLFAEDEKEEGKEERGRDFGFKLSELFHLFLDFIASSFAADFFFGGGVFTCSLLLWCFIRPCPSVGQRFFFIICFVDGD